MSDTAILARLKNGIKNKDLSIRTITVTCGPRPEIFMGDRLITHGMENAIAELSISAITPHGVDILGNLFYKKSNNHEP